MKVVKYKTVDGGEVELQIPETPEEERQVQKEMQVGKISDAHGFADEQPDREE